VTAIGNTKARAIVILDACHAGAAGEEGITTNDELTGALFKPGTAVTVIGASKGRQYSRESASVGGGIFTASLAEIIRGPRERVDSNRNGVIELSELYAVLKRRVVESTKGEQTPWIARNQMIGEVPLF
jgi:uncharacterized caspase-like protein